MHAIFDSEMPLLRVKSIYRMTQYMLFRAVIRSIMIGLIFLASLNPAYSEPQYDLSVIESHIEETLAANQIRGAAVAIVDKGQVAFIGTYGQDGRDQPVTDKTAFNLGSMSKAFTALAAMRLVEEGRIGLDTPVTSLLPELKLFAPKGADIATLVHFLTHTSGLPARTPQQSPSASLEEHVAALKEVQLASFPGTRHVYTSANYLVAARMLEVATGETFPDLLKQSVLEPLGFDAGSAMPDGSAKPVGYRYMTIWPMLVNRPADRGRLGAASLTASVSEMARFLQFSLGDGSWNGTQLLSTAGLESMHSGIAQGKGFRYGYGWRDGNQRGHRRVHHGGLLPDHQGMMILLPELETGVVVLLNTSSTLPLPLLPVSHRLASEIVGYVTGQPPRLNWPSYRIWLMVFWGALAAILLHQIYTVVRVLAGRDPARQPKRAAAGEVAIMIALMIGLPILLELSWPQIMHQSPDVALWMAAMWLLTAVSAISRIRSRPRAADGYDQTAKQV